MRDGWNEQRANGRTNTAMGLLSNVETVNRIGICRQFANKSAASSLAHETKRDERDNKGKENMLRL